MEKATKLKRICQNPTQPSTNRSIAEPDDG